MKLKDVSLSSSLFLIIGVLIPHCVFAGGLKNQQRWDTINGVLKPSYFDPATKACGAPISFVVNEASFKDDIYANTKSPYLCQWPAYLLKQWCEMEDKRLRNAVVKEIKKVSCKFGGKGKHKFELKKNGTFEWTVDYEYKNANGDAIVQEMADYLREKL